MVLILMGLLGAEGAAAAASGCCCLAAGAKLALAGLLPVSCAGKLENRLAPLEEEDDDDLGRSAGFFC